MGYALEGGAPGGYFHSALDLAAGKVAGVTTVNKFGRTTNADNGVACDIWDRANATHNQPVWLAPTAARIHTIASTSDNDGKTGAPSSTGARTIRVYGLKTWDTVESSEDITLDGTTGVTTVNSYVIIHRMKVLTSGASGPNIGVITATAASDATVTAQINANQGQTQMAIYGVASTETLYIMGFYGSLNKAGLTAHGDVELLWCFDVENQPKVFQIKHTLGLDQEGVGAIYHTFQIPNGFAGPGILKLRVTASANDTDVSGGFDLVRVTN